jgi:ABC-type glycerol-3-phosphate transport system substrate-binding protein
MHQPLTRRALIRAGAASLLGVAGATLLVACGGTTTSSALASSASSSPAAATSAARTTAAAADSSAASTRAASAPETKGITLTYMSPDSVGRHEVEQMIYADYSKAHGGVTVEIVSGGSSWAPLQDKLKTMIAGGTPPDCYQNASGNWLGVQSVLVEFSTLLAQAKLDPQRIFALPAIQTFTDAAGKIWALPLVGISQDALAYNQDMFDSAGLPHPPVDPADTSWTMEAFLEDAQKLTKPDQLQFGFGGSVGGDDTGGYERPTYFGQGAWDDTTQKAQLDQPGALQGLQFFKDLRDRYMVQPNAQQVTAIGAKGDVFTSGKIGMQVIYGYVLKLNFKWGLAALPHSSPQNVAGRQFAQPLFAVKTAHADQTWSLLQWLMVPANAARFPLSGHYAVSPVNGASDLAIQTYKDQVGVDPQAFLQMSSHSHVAGWGMFKYPGWDKINTWLKDNLPAFDQGKQSAADYGKAASAYIDANIHTS